MLLLLVLQLFYLGFWPGVKPGQSRGGDGVNPGWRLERSWAQPELGRVNPGWSLERSWAQPELGRGRSGMKPGQRWGWRRGESGWSLGNGLTCGIGFYKENVEFPLSDASQYEYSPCRSDAGRSRSQGRDGVETR